MALLFALSALLLPAIAPAVELELPGRATEVLTREGASGSHPFATGPWSGSEVPTLTARGTFFETVWQIAADDISTGVLMDRLSDQLAAQGYRIDFTCDAESCGGFDFRYGLPVGQAPEMHIDLGDYQYLSAHRDTDYGTARAALVVSRGGATGFVHLAAIDPATGASDTAPVILSSRSPDPQALAPGEDLSATVPTDLIARILATGSVPLDDLAFQTGAASLSGTRYDSLQSLAIFLAEDPSRRIVLVGHTDATGSLSVNIALSERRAEAVRAFLVDQMGVRPEQVTASGIGYLAPRASNLTDAGRDANRRVEAVLTSVN